MVDGCEFETDGRLLVKKLLLAFLSLIILGVACIFGVVAYTIHAAGAPGPLADSRIVLIERGKGVSAIGDTLEAEGVVSSALVFKIISRLEADQRPMKAGEYEFTPQISVRAAIEKMRNGETYDRKVTFPEGVTSWQVVEILKAREDMSGELPEIPPEGTLLPDTYHYIKDEDRAAILGRMKEAMNKALDEAWERRVEGLPINTKQEALILASIIEKETGVAAEREKIAGVFTNRLRRGMALQTDPTVIYAMTRGKVQTDGQGPIGRRLLTKDLQYDSPYNTYLYAGLPPGPIANPGKASIIAALNPEVHDYVYFVADGSGGHAFGKTLAEHNANVVKWRAIRRSQQQ